MIAMVDGESHLASGVEKECRDTTQENFSEREEELNLWSEDHVIYLEKQIENDQDIPLPKASVL